MREALRHLIVYSKQTILVSRSLSASRTQSEVLLLVLEIFPFVSVCFCVTQRRRPLSTLIYNDERSGFVAACLSQTTFRTSCVCISLARGETEERH